MKTKQAKTESDIHADISDKLREVYELSLLYDFYGELLGEHKQRIFEDYILNDLSLAEIADNTGISRQGVHDIIKRCSKSLHEYESKLCLVKKFEHTKQLAEEIKQISEEIESNGDLSRIHDIVARSERILQEL